MTHDRNASDTPPVPRTRPTERPLTARSVLASALLGSDPPELSVSQLVRLAGLFAINENRARVALSRMITAGEVSTDGAGLYRLEGDLLARRSRQQASVAGGTRRWTGSWWTVVVTATGSDAETRAARRTVLTRARLGALRDGVWMRPDNTDLDVAAIAADVVTMTSRLDTDPFLLAARLWDLAGWDDHATDLVRRLERTPPTDTSVLAPGFVLSAAVLRHLQADPLLPPELLPADWRGEELRAVYEAWDAAYRDQLAAWHRSR